MKISLQNLKVLGWIILIITIVITPFFSLAQKTMVITTSSPEAKEYFEKGRNLFVINEREAANKLFDKAIKADPEFASAYLFKAYSGSDYQVWRTNLKKAVELKHKASEGERLFILYVEAFDRRDVKQQEKYLLEMVEKYPDDIWVQFYSGGFYLGNNNVEKAKEHYNNALKLDASFAATYRMMAQAYVNQKNINDAEEYFKKYIEMLPDRPNSYYAYGTFLKGQTRFDEAITNLKKAYKIGDKYKPALIGIGDCHLLKNKYEEARKYYGEHLELSEKPAQKEQGLFYIALTYLYAQDLDNYTRYIEKFTKNAKENKQYRGYIASYSDMGIVYIEAGKPEKGKEYIDKAVSLIDKLPLDENMKNNKLRDAMMWKALSYISLNQLPEAKAEIEKFEAAWEGKGDVNKQSHYKLNKAKYFLAVGEYQQVIDLFPDHTTYPPIQYVLGCAYEKMGKKKEALERYKTVHDFNYLSWPAALVIPKMKERENILKAEL